MSSSRTLPKTVTCLLLAAILVGTFAVYAPTLRYSFVYDDHGQIQENAWLRNWQHVGDYFTKRTWAHMATTASFYRPLFMLWTNLNYSLFGDDPLGWHLATVLMHVLATLLAFLLARRLLGSDNAALFAALVFALHPAHIESVAWIAGVTDPLMFALFVAAWLCELRAEEETDRRRLWLTTAVLLYAGSLLVKETAIIFPILVFAFAIGKNNMRYAFHRSLPFAIVAALNLVIRVLILHGMAEVLQPISREAVLLTAPSLICFYFGHLLLPINLSGFYDFPIVTHIGLRSFVLPTMTLAALGILIWLADRKLRDNKTTFRVSILLIVLPLLPALNLRVLQPYNFAHDRYLYLPAFGFALLLGIAFAQLPSNTWKWVIASALATAFMIAVSIQEQIWRDDATLYLDAIKYAPGNPIPPNNLATILFRLKRCPEAIDLLDRVAERHPEYWSAYANLGHCYEQLHDPMRAEYYYREAYKRFPDAWLIERADFLHSSINHPPDAQ